MNHRFSEGRLDPFSQWCMAISLIRGASHFRSTTYLVHADQIDTVFSVGSMIAMDRDSQYNGRV